MDCLLLSHNNGVTILYGVEWQGSKVVVQFKLSRGLHMYAHKHAANKIVTTGERTHIQ